MVLWPPGTSLSRVSSGTFYFERIDSQLIFGTSRSRPSRDAIRHEVRRRRPSRPEKDDRQHAVLHLQGERDQGIVQGCHPEDRVGNLADCLHGLVCGLRQGCVSAGLQAGS